ncbi:MAG: single-stranded-DNA-specific exonuclease RecJ [Clostridia bacterium]|nr:single-stranded-DNA-specific exonuclease RecJ [Clostridia bacterium]
MAFKKWIVSSSDKMLAKELAEECDTDPFATAIAVGRGISDAAELEQFFACEPLLCDPHELADISLAAEIVNQAIVDGKIIAVFGDYDCDGVVATTLLTDYLESRGAKVIPYIPDRVSEGYGMNVAAVEALAKQNVGLIVTVDNGIACVEEIARANELGMQVVVTDHHLPPEVLPSAAAVVDPHRADCPSSFKEICGAEVAFKLACVMADMEPEQMLARYADLLAVATVGDVMPLRNENRSIVRAGILLLKSAPRTGLSALMNVAGLERDKLSAGNLSFGLVPRINAAGRMGSALTAFELLRCTDINRALGIANELEGANALRQQTERKILAEACDLIEQNGYAHHRVIVVSAAGWHPGVVGIVASKVVERYGKPALVLCENGDVAEGSGRSISDFSLYDALFACKDVLLKFGGHELAAGLGLKKENLDLLRKRLDEYAKTLPRAIPHLKIDLRLKPEALSVDMADALELLEPFGMGNPTPVFGLFGVSLEKITPIGAGKHLKLLFSKNGNPFQALLFGVTPQQFCFCTGDVMDLAVTLGTNLYQGVRSLSVQIKALRMSDVDEDALFEDLFDYDDYLCGDEMPTEKAPTREEIGLVYRRITKESVRAERMKYITLKRPGYAKTQLALTVLQELGLIRLQEGMLCAIPSATKNPLENSPTYSKLTNGGMTDERG